MLPERIRTERLRLRPLAHDDAPAIHAGLAEWEVIRWLSAPPHPYRLADAEDFIANQKNFAGQGGRIYAIDDGSGLIGMIGVDRRAAAMNLGYWLAREHWGLGMMTEAATAVVDAFFAGRPDIVLVSGLFEGNLASLRIQARLGFVRVAETTAMSRPHGKRLPHITTWLGRPRWREMRARRESLAASLAGEQVETPAPSPLAAFRGR
jgi:RimJ/RimL family protein N-acetyltransferase